MAKLYVLPCVQTRLIKQPPDAQPGDRFLDVEICNDSLRDEGIVRGEHVTAKFGMASPGDLAVICSNGYYYVSRFTEKWVRSVHFYIFCDEHGKIIERTGARVIGPVVDPPLNLHRQADEQNSSETVSEERVSGS